MQARGQLCLALACLILCAAGCKRDPDSRSAAAREKIAAMQAAIHNVIFVSIDTLRADHLGCYGHPFVKTPTLDALAKESVLFEQCVSAAPTTLASHTSMMTGTYPHRHGAFKNGRRVGDDNVMLAEVLKEAGFVTTGFIAAAPLGPKVNFDQGFDDYNARYTWGEHGRGGGVQRRANEVTNSVLEWLSQRPEQEADPQSAESRWFLFVHYFDPHWPYTAPAPFAGMYRTDSLPVDGSMETIQQARGMLKQGFFPPNVRNFVKGAGLTKARTPHDPVRRNLWEQGLRLAPILDAEYGAEVSFTDHHLGRLFDELRERNRFDNSLIIVTADHGETMHEHDNVFNHGVSVYETEIHIPLIVRFPQGRFGGQRVSRLISNIDLMPTILELVGLPRHDGIEGESFAPIIDGPLPPRAPVFAEATQPWNNPKFHDDPVWPNRGKFQCIRTERHKYMFRIPDQQFRFYDLQSDPGEQTNLLENAREYDADIVEDLKERLTRWRDDAHPIQAEDVKAKEHIEALRSLGYIGGDPDETDQPAPQPDPNDGDKP
jgi:arylsulfatase